MYALRSNQRGHWCSLCTKNRAVKRSKYYTFYSCDECLPQAIEKELEEMRRESHMTEADHQTWGRL
ncbi:hypothetical protein [Acinetobacter sp. A47]|uniref:hypothetical protein n=1 Tax=Acinetobacter sp. A47 TaxID=1561217 RepID=UPI001269C819|nr:hypothetical protein [Acinetobacter sp. A47]